jgi:hypothetical protein
VWFIVGFSSLVKFFVALSAIFSIFSWFKVESVYNPIDLKAFKYVEEGNRNMRSEKIAMSTEFIFYSFPSAILALVHYYKVGPDIFVIIKCVTVFISFIHIESFLETHFESKDCATFNLEEPVQVQVY